MRAPRPNGKRWYIYSLNDGMTGEVRYIGWTVNMKRRMDDHIREARNNAIDTHKARWIRAQLRSGTVPTMHEIENGIDNTWAEREMFWISHYRNNGFKLTNATDGGEGCLGRAYNESTSRKISEALKDRPLTDEHRLKLSLAHRNVSLSDTHRKNISLGHANTDYSEMSRKGWIARKERYLEHVPINALLDIRAEYLKLLGARKRLPNGVGEAFCHVHGINKDMLSRIVKLKTWTLKDHVLAS